MTSHKALEEISFSIMHELTENELGIFHSSEVQRTIWSYPNKHFFFLLCNWEASGIVFQWGTGLASSGRRLCPGQTLPLFLTAKEPSRVTGKALISPESCIDSLSRSRATGMQKMGEWSFAFGIAWSLCLNSLCWLVC